MSRAFEPWQSAAAAAATTTTTTPSAPPATSLTPAQRALNLIVFANRAPVTVSKLHANDTDEPLAFKASGGGLATALRTVTGYEIYHLGWPGASFTTDQKQKIAAYFKTKKIHPVFLSDGEKKLFYDIMANQYLWLLFHSLLDDIASTPYDEGQFNKALDCYRKINQRYADMVKGEEYPNPIYWVHDYHLMKLPLYLRLAQPHAKIGFFLHIPFPPYDVFNRTSDGLRLLREMLEGLRACDHIGFHTPEYRDNFIDCMRQCYPGRVQADFGAINKSGKHSAASFVEHNYIIVDRRVVRVSVNPIGIDYNFYAADYRERQHMEAFCSNSPDSISVDVLAPKIQALQTKAQGIMHDGRSIILSVQRLDPSKAILQQLDAFAAFAEQDPNRAKHTCFWLIVNPSSRDNPVYKRLQAAVNAKVATINEACRRHPDIGQPLIDYHNTSFSSAEVCVLYRYAKVLLATPFKDGMNLTILEFIAAHQDRLGVPIVGIGAGAAHYVCDGDKGALKVDARDVKTITAALKRALAMPDAEQQRRMQWLHTLVRERNVENWTRRCLKALAKPHRLPKSPTPSPAGSPARVHGGAPQFVGTAQRARVHSGVSDTSAATDEVVGGRGRSSSFSGAPTAFVSIPPASSTLPRASTSSAARQLFAQDNTAAGAAASSAASSASVTPAASRDSYATTTSMMSTTTTTTITAISPMSLGTTDNNSTRDVAYDLDDDDDDDDDAYHQSPPHHPNTSSPAPVLRAARAPAQPSPRRHSGGNAPASATHSAPAPPALVRRWSSGEMVTTLWRSPSPDNASTAEHSAATSLSGEAQCKSRMVISSTPTSPRA